MGTIQPSHAVSQNSKLLLNQSAQAGAVCGWSYRDTWTGRLDCFTWAPRSRASLSAGIFVLSFPYHTCTSPGTRSILYFCTLSHTDSWIYMAAYLSCSQYRGDDSKTLSEWLIWTKTKCLTTVSICRDKGSITVTPLQIPSAEIPSPSI